MAKQTKDPKHAQKKNVYGLFSFEIFLQNEIDISKIMVNEFDLT